MCRYASRIALVSSGPVGSRALDLAQVLLASSTRASSRATRRRSGARERAAARTPAAVADDQRRTDGDARAPRDALEHDAARHARRRWAAGESPAAEAARRGGGLSRSSTLSEPVAMSFADRRHAFLGLLARRAHLEHRSFRSAKEQDAHHALAVRGLVLARDLDLARIRDASCTSFVAARAWRPS